MQCKNKKCRREFTPPKKNSSQVYCSRECAPYGYMKMEDQRDKAKRSIYDKQTDAVEEESFLM